MASAYKIPEAEWKSYKAHLHSLYITEDKKLAEVIERAACDYGFHARFVPCYASSAAVALTLILARHNTYDSLTSGVSRRTRVVTSGKESLERFASGSLVAKTARSLSKTSGFRTRNCVKRSRGMPYTPKIPSAQVRDSDCLFDQIINTFASPKL